MADTGMIGLEDVEAAPKVKPRDGEDGEEGRRQERKEVAGPTEISADDWEKKFVELQKGQAVIVGADIWEAAEADQKMKDDAFGKWIQGQPQP